jgi:hypothetical protein
VEKRSLPAPIPKINEETYWELGKIGTNLNQITRAINRAVKEGSPISADPRPEILKLTKKIEEVRLELINLQRLENFDWKNYQGQWIRGSMLLCAWEG